ncbi:hypothetical protein ACFLZ1_02405 [Patescibacteria group bacterium]
MALQEMQAERQSFKDLLAELDISSAERYILAPRNPGDMRLNYAGDEWLVLREKKSGDGLWLTVSFRRVDQIEGQEEPEESLDGDERTRVIELPKLIPATEAEIDRKIEKMCRVVDNPKFKKGQQSNLFRAEVVTSLLKVAYRAGSQKPKTGGKDLISNTVKHLVFGDIDPDKDEWPESIKEKSEDGAVALAEGLYELLWTDAVCRGVHTGQERAKPMKIDNTFPLNIKHRLLFEQCLEYLAGRTRDGKKAEKGNRIFAAKIVAVQCLSSLKSGVLRAPRLSFVSPDNYYNEEHNRRWFFDKNDVRVLEELVPFRLAYLLRGFLERRTENFAGGTVLDSKAFSGKDLQYFIKLYDLVYLGKKRNRRVRVEKPLDRVAKTDTVEREVGVQPGDEGDPALTITPEERSRLPVVGLRGRLTKGLRKKKRRKPPFE